VSVDGVMRTLQQRGYIDEIGKDPGPGQAVLFGTTRLFLEKLGINSLEELPPLRGFVPSADVVEQLEQGLRPDREPLRPEDAMARDDPLDGDLDDGGLSDDRLTGSSVPDDLSGFDEVLGIAPAPDDVDGDADDGDDQDDQDDQDDGTP
jgi:segregation and condensation protein B